MKITLYHGTSSKHLDSILKNGLKTPYLTSSIDLANYYAEIETEDTQYNEIVLEVIVDTEFLRIDENSMSEPVSYDEYDTEEVEEMVQEEWDRLAKLHPEWVKDDVITIPLKYYEASLNTTSTCWFEGTVKAENIKVL